MQQGVAPDGPALEQTIETHLYNRALIPITVTFLDICTCLTLREQLWLPMRHTQVRAVPHQDVIH
jgi:hypothetical protein